MKAHLAAYLVGCLLIGSFLYTVAYMTFLIPANAQQLAGVLRIQQEYPVLNPLIKDCLLDGQITAWELTKIYGEYNQLKASERMQELEGVINKNKLGIKDRLEDANKEVYVK